MDDDDDSEVEMLSISSGDEESSKDRGSESRNRAGSGGRRAGKDDDGDWDGGEPDSWKRVDEAELSCDRIIDNKTLKLITEYSESSPAKSDKDYLDSNIRDIESKLKRIEEDPEGSGTSHLFNCIQGVSSQANRAFGSLFERQAQAEKIRSVQGMLQRHTMHVFVAGLSSCQYAHLSRLNSIPVVSKWKSMVEKVGILKRVLEEVEKIMYEFKGMLYKSLEDPNIEFRNLENIVRILLELEPDSDPVWHYLNIQMPVALLIRGLLEKCTLDHEARMELLQNEIREKALSDAKWKQIQQDLNQTADVDYSLTPENSHLLGDSEPVDFNGQKLTLLGESISAARADEHLALCPLKKPPPPPYPIIREPPPSLLLWNAKWCAVADVSVASCIELAVHFLKVRNTVIGVGKSSSKLALFLKWLVAGVTEQLLLEILDRNLQRLCSVNLFCVHLKVFIVLVQSSQVSADSNVNNSANKSEEKVGDGKYSSHSLDEVAGMIRSTISVYESKVHNTFRDLEESNILQPFMRDAIKEISKHAKLLKQKNQLLQLLSEITKIYILRLCSWMRASTEESFLQIQSSPEPHHGSMIPMNNLRSMMIQSLRSEATKTEDTFAQLQEIQESVRLAFLNCLLDFAGHLERSGGDLAQNRSSKGNLHLQNGYPHELQENYSDPVPGSVVDPHQQLLMVLSNIGYCKDELSRELYYKYRHIWLQSRGRDEEDSDMQDLVMSFSGLEEKALNSTLLRSSMGGSTCSQGCARCCCRVIAYLVAVHAEVFAACKPLLDKTLGILVEGLIDTFLSLFHENKTKDLRSFDANGFCQLMLELEYFETILNPHFTSDARESLKSLQGVLLEKATESVTETKRLQVITGGPPVGALAQQYSSELLQGELERTRINTACFVESIALDSVPESARAAYASFRGSMDSPSRNFRGNSQPVGSPGFSRQRRR
ncbi:hypothetical protein C3L33_01808, partial [Rhododendron williamsianum]